MEGVDQTLVYSGGRCVRTNFILTDPRFALALPNKIHIQVGREALPTLLPHIVDNLSSKYSHAHAAAIEQLILGLFRADVVHTITILRGHAEPPSIAVTYHPQCWLTDDTLSAYLVALEWAFATLLTADVPA